MLGVEGDWQWANQSATSCGIVCASATFTNPNVQTTSNFSVYQKVQWFATARGRIGWTPIDGAMFYATAGRAWMRIDETDSTFSFASSPSLSLATAASFSNTASGYVVGGGSELRLWGNWTGKLEYLHIDVGGTSNTGAQQGIFQVTTTTGRIKDDIFRVGLNYQFH